MIAKGTKSLFADPANRIAAKAGSAAAAAKRAL